MDRNFIVTLLDTVDFGIRAKTTLKDEKELANFLLHYDTDRYLIEEIAVVGNFQEPDIFIKKEKNLEMGG